MAKQMRPVSNAIPCDALTYRSLTSNDIQARFTTAEAARVCYTTSLCIAYRPTIMVWTVVLILVLVLAGPVLDKSYSLI